MKKTVCFIVLCGIMGVAGWTAAQNEGAAGIAPASRGDGKQVVCPVMGGAVNTNLFVDYEGWRIYVCCPGCSDAVRKTPAVYIQRMKEEGVTPDRIPSTSEVRSAEVIKTDGAE